MGTPCNRKRRVQRPVLTSDKLAGGNPNKLKAQERDSARRKFPETFNQKLHSHFECVNLQTYFVRIRFHFAGSRSMRFQCARTMPAYSPF